MSRAQLAILLFLFLGIFITLVSIFVLNQGGNSKEGKQATEDYYLEGDQKIGNGYLHTDGSTIILYANINNIQKNADKVKAKLSTFSQRSISFDISLFDKNIFPYLLIVSSPNRSNLYETESKKTVLKNASDAYNSTKRLENRLVQITFYLKLRGEEFRTITNCNSQLLNYLQGKLKELNCMPSIDQLAVYEN